MTEKSSPLYEGDERIFTLSDVKQLYIRLKKKIFRAAMIGAVLSFGFFLLKPIKFKVEATFKEAAEKSGGEGALGALLGSAGFSAGQPQAAVFMKSQGVMEPLVERLGLNAEIPRGGGILLKVYRRLRDNLFAEMGRPLPDIDPFYFQDVSYQGELGLSYWVRFDDETHFALLDGNKKSIASCEIGVEVRLPEAAFTMVKAPKNLRIHRFYPLTISPSRPVAKGLRNHIQISSDKTNKSICELTLLHRDRHLGVRILNGLMAEYQRYLKREHDEVATEQLAYLESKQNQIFQKLSGVFDDYTGYLSRNLAHEGFIGLDQESKMILSPLQEMMSKMIAIDVELSRLDQLEKEDRLAAPADDGPFSRHLLDISRSIGELKQQRDLLELSLQQRQSTDQHRLEGRRDELREVRSRRDAAKELLSAFDKENEIPQNFPFDPERTLAAWADRLKFSQEDDKEDFAEYLDNHIRLLSVQEKMLQERFFYGDGSPKEFEGIDLSTVRTLFVDYNNKLDSCEASMRHYSQLQGEIDQKGFELSSLSSVLKDPLSQKIIEQASQVGIQLKDEKYRSAKEGERWNEELALQKKILKDHLAQLFKVEDLNASLIREKIVGLQEVSLDCIHREISVLSEQASDGIKERRSSLLQEKQLLEKKISELRERASQGLPEKWRQEKWLDLKTDMATGMMEKLTELVESKTIGHHLHHVESKPLDIATLPKGPLKPGLFKMAFLGGFGVGFGFFFLQLLRTILNGFPSSFDKLRAMRFPLLGAISPVCDGPAVDGAKGSDLELLRQISLFFEKAPKAKTVCLLAGKGPDYSYALAENLARRSIRSIVVRCDFQAKFRAEDLPGLLQIWKGEISELPIRKGEGYDILNSGGFTPYGVEVIQSAPFQQLLDLLKKKYDAVFLLFRSQLNLAESTAALRLCDKAIVTVSGEPTELLTPFANWAYHEGDNRLTFVVTDHP